MSESIRTYLREHLLEGKPSKAQLDAAVRASRLYQGSMTTARMRDQQRLYDRMMKLARSIADKTGMDLEDVLNQLSAQASKLGPLTPMAGKDI